MEALSNLGIDLWNILLYVVNMGVIYFILAKFVIPKILHYLDERRYAIKNNIDEAEQLRAEMAKQKELMEKEKAKMQAQLAEELSNSRKQIEAKQKSAEAEIEAKKAKMLEEVQTVIRAEKDALMANAEHEMLKLMQKIILHIVSNQIPQDVVKNSVETAWKQYQK